jgi:restriction system protein
MARRKSGIFDPDYRSKGWNESRFAPKNSALNITQYSLLLATAVTLMPLGVATWVVKRPIDGLVLGISVVGFFISWMLIAILIRIREGRRIKRHLAEQEAEKTKPDAVFNFDITVKETAVQSPHEFEREVAWLINTLTEQKAVVTGKSGDGGVDIKVYKGKAFVGIIQCKKYNDRRALSPSHVRELYAVRERFDVPIAYLVTTAYFTDATEREAKELGIKLVDGNELNVMRRKARLKLAGKLEESEQG